MTLHGNKPLRVVSSALVKKTIDTAETELRSCWRVVAALSSCKLEPDFGESLVKFQLRLLEAIATVEETYRVIKQEEKRLVSRKSRLNPDWFRKRMAQLATYTKALAHVLGIARAIGDGFAWFFYERDRKLIDEHLKHQRQPLLPPKIGALGERLTLKNMLVIDQKMLLYHGITTFLRIGDFSLIDLKTMRVSSIGELKTERPDDEHIQTHVALVASNPAQLPRIPIRKGAPKAAPAILPAAMVERRKRQLKVMRAAMMAAATRGRKAMEATRNDFHFAELEQVASRCGSRKFEWAQVGDGFIMGAVRLSPSRTRKLSSLLLNKATERAGHLATDAPEWAMKILSTTKRELNSLIIGTVCGDEKDFIAPRSAFPVALWPVDPAVLEDVLFSGVMLLTLLNPAHLWASIAEQGFELEFDEKGCVASATKKYGERVMELKNLGYYTHLISCFMLTERSVLALIEQLIEISHDRYKGGSMKIELDPKINRYRVPPTRKTRAGRIKKPPSGRKLLQ